MPHGGTGPAPGAPVYAKGSQPKALAAIVDKCIEIGVGSRVIGLSAGAENSGRGGEKDKAIKLRGRGEPMEIPRSSDLGRQHGREAGLRLLRQAAIIEHASRMKDTPQRKSRRDGIDRCDQRSFVAHIAAHGDNLSSLLLKLRKETLGLRVRFSASEGKYAARSLPGEPLHSQTAKAGETAGHHVGAIAPNGVTRSGVGRS